MVTEYYFLQISFWCYVKLVLTTTPTGLGAVGIIPIKFSIFDITIVAQ